MGRLQMHGRTESLVHGNDNKRPENRSLQRSCELGVITSFTVLESQFPVTRPTSWASFRPPPLYGGYAPRINGCHRRLSLHRATPPPAAVATFLHCSRLRLSPPLAAAAPAARRPWLPLQRRRGRPWLPLTPLPAATAAATSRHRRRHGPLQFFPGLAAAAVTCRSRPFQPPPPP